MQGIRNNRARNIKKAKQKEGFMKNRMKKGLALLLGAAMTTGLLAGCGSEGGSENSAASGSEGGNASAEAGGSASDAGGGQIPPNM